jgi:hypothetical protein
MILALESVNVDGTQLLIISGIRRAAQNSGVGTPQYGEGCDCHWSELLAAPFNQQNELLVALQNW